MSKDITKISFILLLDLILFLPIKSGAFEEFSDCYTRCAGDSDCVDSPDAVCSPKHGYSGIPKMCCHAPCTTDSDCPTDEIFYDSEGTERPRYCLMEGRCARNGDPPPPTPTVGECTEDANCQTSFPDRPYCLLRPGSIEGNLCVRCKEDSHCPAGQYCTSRNICRVRSERNCCYDTDCPGTTEICWNGTTSDCVMGNCCKIVEGCTNDTDCQGRRCLPGSVHTPSHCEKSYLPPTAGSIDFGGRCAYPAECSGSYGCIGGGLGICAGTCGNCTNNDECRGKAVRCEDGKCGGTVGVTCTTNEDCERIHGLPGFECRGGICEPPITPTPPAPAAPYVYEITPPELEIPLPTLAGLTKFLSARLEGAAPDRYLIIPWIGEYIAAAYKYAIGITGILAAIMIVIAGLIWLTAGGSAERVSMARSFIENALVGLVIALTSYLLLYAINPKLTEFESLKIRFIEREDEIGQPVIIKVDAQGNITAASGETAEQAAAKGAAPTESSTVSSAATCTILYVTDTHHNPACFKRIATAMLSEPNIDMIIMGGDILVDKEAEGNQEQLWSNQWDQASKELREKFPDKRGPGQQKLFAAQGNHDLTAPFTARFGANLQKATCGNVDFFLFPWSKPPTNQIESQLNTSTAQWKVVVSHLPFYACREGERTQPAALRNALIAGGVKFVLTGDTHLYCDGTKDDVRFIIGGTGGPKWRACKNPPSGFICESGPKLTYFRIEFSNSINVQRKTLAPPSDCTMYEAH